MTARTGDRITFGLAVAGLLIAGYLTLLHYDSSVRLVCSAGSFVNCETVLSSPSATVLHLPVAVWGLFWFAVALVFAGAAFLTDMHPATFDLSTARTALLAWTIAGTAGVMYLVYQEIGVIGKLCAWCTAVHLIIIAMLIVQSSGSSRDTGEPTGAR